jgi:hypothetical protein
MGKLVGHGHVHVYLVDLKLTGHASKCKFGQNSVFLHMM